MILGAAIYFILMFGNFTLPLLRKEKVCAEIFLSSAILGSILLPVSIFLFGWTSTDSVLLNHFVQRSSWKSYFRAWIPQVISFCNVCDAVWISDMLNVWYKDWKVDHGETIRKYNDYIVGQGTVWLHEGVEADIQISLGICANAFFSTVTEPGVILNLGFCFAVYYLIFMFMTWILTMNHWAQCSVLQRLFTRHFSYYFCMKCDGTPS